MTDVPAGNLEVSVIVPTLNGGEHLRRQVLAILDQFPPTECELIVVDNGSTDETPDLLSSLADHDSRLRVLSYGAPLGVNAARNAGAAAAQGSLLLFTDHDDLVGDGWLDAMRRAFDRGGVVLCGALDFTRLNEGIPGSSLIPLLVPPVSTPWLPLAHGSTLGIARDLLGAAGGWDEAFTFGGDDMSLSWTLQLLGHELTPVPDAVVHIRVRPGLRTLAAQRYRYGIADPLLFRSFRERGMPRHTWKALARLARMLVLAPTCVFSPSRRRWWVRKAMPMFGTMRGSIKYRTFYLG